MDRDTVNIFEFDKHFNLTQTQVCIYLYPSLHDIGIVSRLLFFFYINLDRKI